MASAAACATGPGAQRFSVAVARDASASLPDGRHYVSLRPGRRFDEIYRSGRRSRRGGVTVFQKEGFHILPAAAPRTLPEVGVVAGRRVGNAVRRNRAKRRLRAAADLAPLRSGVTYVLVAGPEVVDVAFGQLVEWVTDAIERGSGGPAAGAAT